MANWSLKVSVGENALDLRRQVGLWRSGEMLTAIPGAPLLPWQLPPTSSHRPHPRATLPFVCWGQQFSSASTWASALSAIESSAPSSKELTHLTAALPLNRVPLQTFFNPGQQRYVYGEKKDLNSSCVWVLGCFRHSRRHDTSKELWFAY